MKNTIVLMALFLAIIPNALAETVSIVPPGNWNRVQALSSGTKVIVELKHAGKIDGEFIRLNEDSIVVKEIGSEKIFPKDEVAQVLWMKRGSRVKNATIVGPIFFGIGFGLGYAAAPQIGDDDNMPGAERAKAGAGVGAIIGGAAAAIAYAHRPGLRSEVIYRSR